MKLIQAIVRPNKVEELCDALDRLTIPGLTVTEVRGHGRQRGHATLYRGREYSVGLLPKMELEIVVPDSVVEEVVRAVVDTARTGEIGDGRIFVRAVEAAYNIRTGERDVG